MKTLNTLKKITLMLTLGVVLLIAPKAWSAIEFVKPNDSAEQIAQTAISGRPNSTSHSHAPEPTTMALLGSGLLSMIISFVRRTYYIAKRSIDLIGSVIGLIIFAPVMVLAAILVKLTSKGPIIYSQVRVGKDGKYFEIYKFRTMRVDAEKETGPVWASKNDNRLTPIGGFLRKSRIDELPQFLNVLMGDMSIIGPRPERPMFVDQFSQQIPDYTKRLDVKPGITGMAQVWHRYDENIADVRKKIKYDILYIKNMCLWTDMLILFRTVRVVLTGAGAK